MVRAHWRSLFYFQTVKLNDFKETKTPVNNYTLSRTAHPIYGTEMERPTITFNSIRKPNGKSENYFLLTVIYCISEILMTVSKPKFI